jgi:hypothetical protein
MTARALDPSFRSSLFGAFNFFASSGQFPALVIPFEVKQVACTILWTGTMT